MSGFDPAAAAAAYVQQLPAAERAAAASHTAWSEGLGLAVVAVLLLACWAIARSGLLIRICARMDAAGRPGWMAGSACGAVLAGLAALAVTPVELVGAVLAGEAPLAALAMALRQDAVYALVGAVAAPLLFGLIRLAPRAWPLICGGFLATLVFASVWLPFAEASGPPPLPAAPAGAARSGLLRLIGETHVPASEVYISANPAIDADVTGVGSARVVISRGLWAKASPEELRGSVGHLISHYVHHDQLSIALLLAALTVGLFLAAKALFEPAARLLGAAVNGPDDAAGAPVLLAIAAVYLCGAICADHAFIRAINVRADQYSLDHARAPDGLAMALLHEWKGQEVDPSPLQEALFYDHPALEGRLLHAMRWKAAHGG